jgi:cob(I)alamin adenosyltransferase
MSKIYTKTGDKGMTSMYSGERVSKNSIYSCTVGEMDELAVRIGVLWSSIDDDISELNTVKIDLRDIQSNIQLINSHICTSKNATYKIPEINQEIDKYLENEIDSFQEQTPPLTKFILPCVTEQDSRAQMCRVQARRAERYLVDFVNSSADTHKLDPIILRYVNRLSDYFFALSRYICNINGHPDHFAKS